MLDCLTTLIGLSDNACTCHEDDRPASYNTSESGYFITDFEDGVPLLHSVFAAQDCGAGSIWDVLDKSRRQAIIDFETDLFAAIYNNHAGRFSTYSGEIGQRRTTGNLTGYNGQFTGIRILAREYRGTKITISKIAINTNYSGTIPVKIFSSDDPTTVIHTETINAVAGSWIENTLSTPLTLELFGTDYDKLYYYIVYDATSIQPVNNKFTCCGKRLGWKQYAEIDAISTDDLTQVKTATNLAMGLSVTASLFCDGGDWLCDLDELGDYNGKSVIAKSLQFKAAAKLISAILDSGNINYYTLLNREALYGKRNHFNKRYFENINWIAENIPSYVTDCFKCSDKKIKKSSIII